MNERRSISGRAASAPHETAVEPSAFEPGARPRPFVGTEFPSGSALWRRWLELHREGDSAAETQVFPRARPTSSPGSAPSKATPSPPSPLPASGAARSADADRKLFAIYAEAFEPVINIRRHAPQQRPSHPAAASRRSPAVSPRVESTLTRLAEAARRLLGRSPLPATIATKEAAPPLVGCRSRAARRALLCCVCALCVGALALWRPSSSASAALAASPAESFTPASSQGNVPRVESRKPERRDPVNPTDSRSVAATIAGAALASSRPAGVSVSEQGTGRAARTAQEASDAALLTKRAVDALAAGDRASAAAHYRELARLAPDDRRFLDAARILSRPTRGSR